MRVEFNQGVPTGCIDWLWKNVGSGNIYPGGLRHTYASCEADKWTYERVEVEIRSTNGHEDSNTKYVPTITVKDPKLATLFALRWV